MLDSLYWNAHRHFAPAAPHHLTDSDEDKEADDAADDAADAAAIAAF